MLDRDTRTAILRLATEGLAARDIARTLHISRGAVKRVLRSGQVEVPALARDRIATDHLDRIRDLYVQCKGNLVRVHEELCAATGVEIAYSTLTSFCRDHGIGHKLKRAAGRYEFAPGEEMQHDTSPHDVKIATQTRRLQCASLVLCYSTMVFAQLYPVFNRFWCKTFLTDGLRYFDGAAERCMLDNASIVVAYGTGANAVMAPEMEAFAQRFDFTFVAHEKGDANRSARVERPFDYIERNFYPGRTFTDLADCNRQLREWCDKVNARPKDKTRIVPREAFRTEMTALKPLPAHVPEVYALHERVVDIEGYVSVHGNRYSVDEQFLGRSVQARESKDRVRIFDGHRLLAEHPRADDGEHVRVTLADHRGQHRAKFSPGEPPLPEEGPMRAAAPELAAMLDALRAHGGSHGPRRVRRLYRLWMDYPIEPLRVALRTALDHGLIDLDRIEVIVLRHIAKDFFRIRRPDDPEGNDHE